MRTPSTGATRRSSYLALTLALASVPPPVAALQDTPDSVAAERHRQSDLALWNARMGSERFALGVSRVVPLGADSVDAPEGVVSRFWLPEGVLKLVVVSDEFVPRVDLFAENILGGGLCHLHEDNERGADSLGIVVGGGFACLGSRFLAAVRARDAGGGAFRVTTVRCEMKGLMAECEDKDPHVARDQAVFELGKDAPEVERGLPVEGILDEGSPALEGEPLGLYRTRFGGAQALRVTVRSAAFTPSVAMLQLEDRAFGMLWHVHADNEEGEGEVALVTRRNPLDGAQPVYVIVVRSKDGRSGPFTMTVEPCEVIFERLRCGG